MGKIFSQSYNANSSFTGGMYPDTTQNLVTLWNRLSDRLALLDLIPQDVV